MLAPILLLILRHLLVPGPDSPVAVNRFLIPSIFSLDIIARLSILTCRSPITYKGQSLGLSRRDSTFTRYLFFFFLIPALFLVNIASAHGANVTLGWNPNSEPDLAGYVLYSSPGAAGQPYDYVATYPLNSINPASPKCTITGMEDDVPYYFVVSAYDTDNYESGYSNEICVMNGSACPPSILVGDFVTRFYQQCLNREPDPAGLAGWSDALLDHRLTGADVARGFIFSPEFIEKNKSNEEFLIILYKAFFNRNPDPGGFNGWLELLNNGTDRGTILDGFLYSQEFIGLCQRYGITPY